MPSRQHIKLELPDSSYVRNREGDSMFGVLFVDVVCRLDEVKVEDVFSFAKIRSSDMVLLL